MQKNNILRLQYNEELYQATIDVFLALNNIKNDDTTDLNNVIKSFNFTSYDGALNIFKSVNCIGNNNCIFIAIKDTRKDTMKAGMFGAIGGTAAAVSTFSGGVVNGIDFNFDALLINKTDSGLGIIPLINSKIPLFTVKVNTMRPIIE